MAAPGVATADDTSQEIAEAVTAQTGAVQTAPTPGLEMGTRGLGLGGVNIGLPTSGEGEGEGGLTIFDVAGTDDAQVAVQPTGTGVRALVNIDNADAPERYPFPVGGAASRLEANADGSVVAYDEAGVSVGSFAAPWARDARGAPVATHYEIEGTTLVQVIKHVGTGVEYGVTADPWWIPTAVVIGRCYINTICRRIMWSKGTQAAIRWALQNLF